MAYTMWCGAFLFRRTVVGPGGVETTSGRMLSFVATCTDGPDAVLARQRHSPEYAGYLAEGWEECHHQIASVPDDDARRHAGLLGLRTAAVSLGWFLVAIPLTILLTMLGMVLGGVP